MQMPKMGMELQKWLQNIGTEKNSTRRDPKTSLFTLFLVPLENPDNHSTIKPILIYK